MISFNEAIALVRSSVVPCGTGEVECHRAAGMVAAQDLPGLVDSPSADVSLKDGFALKGYEAAEATETTGIPFAVIGSAAAGNSWEGEIEPKTTVRILSGAPIPRGADAVVAEEFTRYEGDSLIVLNSADRGRNVLPKGSDIRKGEPIARKGERLKPETAGLLAAGGYGVIPVYRRPKVAIIATGDEVVAPGAPLREGSLYASNLVTLASRSISLAEEVSTLIVGDEKSVLATALSGALETNDAVITSGGAWNGERDLVVGVLDDLGWEKKFHRVAMGPGKAVAFGLYRGKPVFCLPGGPPSNHMAFLQLALPALGLLAGSSGPGLGLLPVRLAEDIRGQSDWTQFIHGTLRETGDYPEFVPMKNDSRLQMMSRSDGIACIPEGADRIVAGTVIIIQKL